MTVKSPGGECSVKDWAHEKSAALFVASELTDDAFARIRDLLLTRRGFDLEMYKNRCIKRRIAARVRACGFSQATPYIEHLQRSDTEADELMAALTIHVSQFFRNPTTFEELKRHVLPEIIEHGRQKKQSELTLWSVGCASGEEPYSLALLIKGMDLKGLPVTIVGSDLSARILDQAKKGLYDPTRLAQVSPQTLMAFFTREGRNYRLKESIRSMVRFEQHNVLTGHNFPSADLILCRNVLIYFSREEQDYIIERFASALSPFGRLVLGRAENLMGRGRTLFECVNTSERIYQLRPQA